MPNKENFPTIFSDQYLCKVDHLPVAGFPHLYPHFLLSDSKVDSVFSECKQYLIEQGGLPQVIEVDSESIRLNGSDVNGHFLNDLLKGNVNFEKHLDRWEIVDVVLKTYFPSLYQKISNTLEYPILIKWNLNSLNFLREREFCIVEQFVCGQRKYNITTLFHGVTGNELFWEELASRGNFYMDVST